MSKDPPPIPCRATVLSAGTPPGGVPLPPPRPDDPCASPPTETSSPRAATGRGCAPRFDAESVSPAGISAEAGSRIAAARAPSPRHAPVRHGRSRPRGSRSAPARTAAAPIARASRVLARPSEVALVRAPSAHRRIRRGRFAPCPARRGPAFRRPGRGPPAGSDRNRAGGANGSARSDPSRRGAAPVDRRGGLSSHPRRPPPKAPHPSRFPRRASGLYRPRPRPIRIAPKSIPTIRGYTWTSRGLGLSSVGR